MFQQSLQRFKLVPIVGIKLGNQSIVFVNLLSLLSLDFLNCLGFGCLGADDVDSLLVEYRDAVATL